MKEYTTDQLRNIALIGHGGVGKTTLNEAALFTAGETNRQGTVDDGTTVSDYNEDEIERKISISACLSHLDWKNHKINIIDTPGYTDFTGEVIGALRVVEGAVVLLNAVTGVEVGTEKVWRDAEKNGVARLLFINSMDKEHADFYKALDMARDRFGTAVVPLQLPIGQAADFKGVVDLVSMKALLFESGSGKFTEGDIPEDMKGKVDEYREKFVEGVAESDDELLEIFFEAGDLTDEQMKKGLKKGILSGQVYPVFCGAAEDNMGTGALLDAIIDYVPSPSQVPIDDGTLEPKADGPAAALVFKTISEPHVGELSLFRVYSGTIKTGADMFNVTNDQSERIGQISTLKGRERKEIGLVTAGDMGAVVKLKNTHTGDTLSDKKAKIALKGIDFPEPNIRIAIEPKARGDEEKISNGLQSLHDEDPTFIAKYDPELKQMIISGQGELHLTVIIDRLKRKFKVEVNELQPKIPYRETITAVGDSKYRHKKQTGGAGQFAEVWMRVEPLERGSGVQFESEVVGMAIDRVFIPSIEKGVRAAAQDGVISGCIVTDVKAVVYDGKQHPVDSKDIAFQIAGREAFKEGFQKAKPILLEPIYDVEATVPEAYTGDVVGDLNSRRGRILGMEAQGPFQVVKAKVPLGEMYKYSTTLRSLTQGTGGHVMKFSHYEEVPRDVQEKIIAQAKAEKEKKE
ncbi:MAG: elongation factor G [Gemmatimonadota bacterium]|nr:MAG: elongation factor G [Gemmatimonadota bacterium]